MTTTEAARELGVSAEYVRGEIRAERLQANTYRRPGKRAVYRITPDQLAAYISTYYRPEVPRGTNSQ